MKFTNEALNNFQNNSGTSSKGLTETLQVHILLYHLKEYLSFLDEARLGLWSEQAGESIHRNILTFWKKYKMNRIDDERNGDHLLRVVIEFSSRHI